MPLLLYCGTAPHANAVGGTENGCACDCAPGKLREARIEQQTRAYEERKLIRGATTGQTGVRRDDMKASPSPAVDRARAVMRANSGERGKGSGDEKGTGRRGSARGSVGGTTAGGAAGMSSSRKSVRLVTPGEERTR